MSQKICKYLCKIDEFNQINSIFCYISYINEVETQTLINDFIELYLILAVTKIVEKSEMIACSLSGLNDLKSDKKAF